MGWDVPWYSARESADELLAGRHFAMPACYLRDGDGRSDDLTGSVPPAGSTC